MSEMAILPFCISHRNFQELSTQAIPLMFNETLMMFLPYPGQPRTGELGYINTRGQKRLQFCTSVRSSGSLHQKSGRTVPRAFLMLTIILPIVSQVNIVMVFIYAKMTDDMVPPKDKILA